jgi:hypothetical protein
MDKEGFRNWLKTTHLAESTQASVLSECRRVEDLLGIDLDAEFVDLVEIPERLWEERLSYVNGRQDQAVANTLIWATKIYWQFLVAKSAKAGAASQAHSAKAGG